jgi:hypothetical protein
MLTTLSNVKSRLALDDSDVRDDTLLTNFIKWVSGRFENDANRKFGYAQNVVDEFQGDETELRVSRYPIDEAQPISFQLLTKNSDGWRAVAGAEFVIRRGCVLSLLSEAGRAREQLRVTYSGGYQLPDAASSQNSPPPLPDDLQLACVEQVAYLYQNKDRLGLVNVAGEGGSLQQLPGMDLLPSVAATVERYGRMMP